MAQRIAELTAAEIDDDRWSSLTREQKDRYLATDHLDRLVRSGEQPEEYLRGVVEIRSMGHRVNEEGGFDLMVAVTERANALGGARLLRRIEMYWDKIGSFRW